MLTFKNANRKQIPLPSIGRGRKILEFGKKQPIFTQGEPRQRGVLSAEGQG